ncbi:MAG: hypothetical protein J6W93_07965 [Clostridia bacterium]|nr:hypothetical protein [Clostridia bacterium]
MNGMDVYNSITRLDENLADGYLNGGKRSFRKRLIVKIIASVLLAAVLITVMAVINKKNEPLFVLTASAGNGENVPIYVGGYLNSLPAECRTNIFGVDHPCFNFDIWPKISDGQSVTELYDISVTYEYEGRPVRVPTEGRMDSHMIIGYLLKRGSSSNIRGYNISGWFSEPAVVYVYITDKATGESAENYRIDVRYSEERGEYDLTVERFDPPKR